MKLFMSFLVFLLCGCICCCSGSPVDDGVEKKLDACVTDVGDELECKFLVAVAEGEPSLCQVPAQMLVYGGYVKEYEGYCEAVAKRSVDDCMSQGEGFSYGCVAAVSALEGDASKCSSLRQPYQSQCFKMYAGIVKECASRADYNMCVAEFSEF